MVAKGCPLKRENGWGPRAPAVEKSFWEADILPLNYTCKLQIRKPVKKVIDSQNNDNFYNI